MNPSRDRFLDLMKNEILKLDLADLDFGIYRILNHRRDEIEAFFDEELPAALDEAMTGEGEDSEFVQSEEDRLYNALYTFFSRYYRDGDFQSQQRRARDARYSVPYNGEDVHFHWRSKGSHYIKTTEELKSYSFRSGAWRVRFELREAFEEPDNVKGTTRYFIPVPDESRTDVGEKGNLFIVPFAFRKLEVDEDKRYGKKSETIDGNSVQERLINDLVDEIERPSGLAKTDLLRHMQRYARKNRTDYFVHPHLGEFLRGELDYYLKNEFLDIEGLTSTDAITDRLVKMRAVREVANRIIDMLDEIESFQARLFEKRKFVLSNSYLVPIRMVSEELWDAVLSSKKQIDQWRAEFGLTRRVGKATLEQHPTLVVDTALFDREFQSVLLAEIDDISDISDGVLINSENYGALRTFGPSWTEEIAIAYIDPPYNTGSDGFLYKDDFSQHSTWLSLLHDRVELLPPLATPGGIFYSSIGDRNARVRESQRLTLAIDDALGEENFLATLVWVKGKESGGDASVIGVHHEYVLMYAIRDASHVIVALDEKDTSRHRTQLPEPNRAVPGSVIYRDGEPFQLINLSKQKDYVVEIRLADGATLEWDSYCPQSTIDKFLDESRLFVGEKGVPYVKSFLADEKAGTQPGTILEQSVGTTKAGGIAIRELFGSKAFDYPKPPGLVARLVQIGNPRSGIVLDFFAGSGSTGHAVIDLNRDNGSRTRFALVEMGEYFDSVLKRRIAKVLYAPEWKAGNPKEEPAFESDVPDWVERSPRLVQVVKLESYEDSLNSLVVDADDQLGNAYRIGYAIPDSVDRSPVFLTTDRLESPFDYQFEVHTDDGVEFQDVDLVTTFNLIKGIRMKRYRELDHNGRRYVVVEGVDSGKTALVLWRSVAGLDPEAEVAFLNEAIPEALGVDLSEYDVIWHNADSAIPKSMSLDAEFKRLMFEPEPALS